MNKKVEDRKKEFDTHLWDHTIDVFQAQFDERRQVSQDEFDILSKIVFLINEKLDDIQISQKIEKELISNRSLIFILLQIAGLTRNKIITDLKASNAQNKLSVPGKPELLAGREAWSVAGPYLIFRIRKSLDLLINFESKNLRQALESINQATYPHWIRQEKAKRQGHEAEYRIAVMLDSLGIPFQPKEKSENPLCRDAQINGISFDIVVPNLVTPKLVFKSTVQTSNIGQFGESKADLEISQAKEMLFETFTEEKRPKLVAMIDGIGFKSNLQGLLGVLENTDEFVQFSTLWKVAVMAAEETSTHIQVALPKEDLVNHKLFLDDWTGRFTTLISISDFISNVDPLNTVSAGEALVARSD